MSPLHSSRKPILHFSESRGSSTGRHPSPATVLLAEDDDAMRETMRIWLTNDEHWEVTEASNGAKALDRIDETLDILVLDRRMPGLSGPEIVNRLDETGFDGTVVVLSAFAPDSHLREDDVALYLSKPIDRETFLARLREVR